MNSIRGITYRHSLGWVLYRNVNRGGGDVVGRGAIPLRGLPENFTFENFNVLNVS